MALGSYLIKAGATEIPAAYIAKGSYKAQLDKIVKGQYQDGNGVDHYEVLPYRKLNVSLEIPNCDATTYESIVNIVKNAFISANEENLLLTAWVPKRAAYVTQEVVFEDESPSIYAIRNGKIYYDKVKLTFKGKGGAVS